METSKKLKITLIILIIITISVISFGGIFVHNKNRMKNILPEYQLGMDLTGGRTVTLEVDKSTVEKKYDENGKEITDSKQEENTTTMQVPVNDESLLTAESYENTKKILEKRLKQLGVYEYSIKLSKTDGVILLTIPEDSSTDIILQYITQKGYLTIVDADTQEVLMDSSDVKDVKVGYGATSSTSSSISVALTIEFNKEGKEKFKNITQTYKNVVEEENETSEEETDEESNKAKQVILRIDDADILTTSFDEVVTTGQLQLSLGTATTNSDLQTKLVNAGNIATILRNDPLKIQYTVTTNRYIESDVTENDLNIVAIIGAALVAILCIISIIKYKKGGIITLVSSIGFLAILLIVLRYTNVVISIEGISAIAIGFILYYLFTICLWEKMKKEDLTSKKQVEKIFVTELKKYIFVILPILILAIVFCFAGWMPVYSFGMILFWAVALNLICQYVITNVLAKEILVK